MKFRPCIDLHQGKVKQIVGSTLRDDCPDVLQTNFEATKPPSYYAKLYKSDSLNGGHIIMLGPNNEKAAEEALGAWPGGMQVGGGINLDNAEKWLDYGASHVIITSAVFKNGEVNWQYLEKIVDRVGRNRLVLDLSCRKQNGIFYIVTDRWQKFTKVAINKQTLLDLSKRCDEFLIHAADVEGKCSGIEEELVTLLGKYTPIPTTYAGGIRNLADMKKIDRLGGGNLDATIGSALDIFGGTTVRYEDAVAYHKQRQEEKNS